MVAGWWLDACQPMPTPGMLVEDGTFILELDSVPALCLSVFLTQSKDIAWTAGYIKNPKFKQSLEKEGAHLWTHCFNYAKEKGYNRVMCYSLVNKLTEKYKRFGMTQTCSNLSSFMRML